jgi:hypothetical protein
MRVGSDLISSYFCLYTDVEMSRQTAARLVTFTRSFSLLASSERCNQRSIKGYVKISSHSICRVVVQSTSAYPVVEFQQVP